MFRIAREKDIERIAEIYARVHDSEESGLASPGWKRGVYPTRKTAEEGVLAGDLYVEEDAGRIVASGRLNQRQEEEYAACSWLYEAPEREVLVLHTLAVDPTLKGKGYGSLFVGFYEEYALTHSCRFLRMDTNEKNAPARALYKKLGFREAGFAPCVFNGMTDVRLVFLEKKI